MNNHLIQRIFACITISICGITNGYSQTDTAKAGNFEGMSLKELLNVKVITASKVSQELGLAPAVVILITREQIRSRGYQSLLDVMYDLPDTKVDDKIYSGIRNSVTVRGTEGSEKFVILLDGISISSPSGEAMPIMENYPVNLAEQIEIVYGPASALYGANAVSGVINIITKKPSSTKGITAEISSVAGTYGYTNTTLFLTKKLNDHADFIISGQYSYDQQPDYSKLYKTDSQLSVASYSTGTLNTIYGGMTPRTPIKPVFEAPMSAYNIYAALHINDFSFSFFSNYTKTPSAFGSNTSNTLYNKDAFIGQSVSMVNASYKKSFSGITSTTSLTASEFNVNPASNYRNLYTSMEPAYKYSACSMIKAEEMLTYEASEKLNITAGTGYESYNSVPESADLDEPVNKNDYIHASYLGTDAFYRPDGLAAQFYFIRYHNIGNYFQALYSAARNLHITLGARYDINSRYGASFNPRAGIVYNPFKATTIKLLYGSAFLAPTASDSYAQYGSFETADSGKTFHSTFLHLPNPALKPITSKNVELNIRQELSSNLILTLDGYYTALSGLHELADDNNSTRLYHNMFNGIPVDYIEVYINQKKQTNYGGSIRLDWKYSFGKIKINSSASAGYVNGTLNDGLAQKSIDKQIDFISPWMFHFTTDIKAGKLSFSPRLILMGRQNIAGIRDTTSTLIRRQTIAGYALLNVSVKYNIGKHISVFTNITNALNQRYRSVGYNMDLKQDIGLFNGQPEEPIRIMGGFNFSF